MNVTSHTITIAKDSINPGYSLLKICNNCCAEPEFVISAVNHEILQPIGNLPIRWRFDSQQMALLQTILLLNRQFDMNLHGIKYVLALHKIKKLLRKKLIKCYK